MPRTVPDPATPLWRAAPRIFEPVPLLLVAAFWYLVVTSILMVGQYYLERYFARGASRKLTTKQLEALAKAQVQNPGM